MRRILLLLEKSKGLDWYPNFHSTEYTLYPSRNYSSPPPEPKESLQTNYAKGDIIKLCEKGSRQANAIFDTIAATGSGQPLPQHHPL